MWAGRSSDSGASGSRIRWGGGTGESQVGLGGRGREWLLPQSHITQSVLDSAQASAGGATRSREHGATWSPEDGARGSL